MRQGEEEREGEEADEKRVSDVPRLTDRTKMSFPSSCAPSADSNQRESDVLKSGV
jgi:hypothetical protein